MARTMTRQAARTIATIAPFVKLRLAQDQRVNLLPLLGSVKAETFTEDKPRLLKGIQRLTRGKLAQDASIGEVAELLDLIDSHGVEADEDVSAAQNKAMEATAKVNAPKLQEDKGKKAKAQDNEEKDMPGKHSGIHELLKDKISAEDLDKVHAMLAGHGDAEDEHDEDEDVDKESEEFHGGEAEDADDLDGDETEGEPGEKLKSLGAETGEDEEYDAPGGGSEPGQEERDNAKEWRRGEKKDRPATDKRMKGAKDKRHAKDRGPSFGARDNPPKFKGMPKPGGGMDRRGRAYDSRSGLVTREEMENGIAAAVKVVSEKQNAQKMAYDKAVKDAQRVERDIREAERAIQPYVGTLSITFDSADQVYAHALRLLNIDVRGVHPSAYPTILKATRQSLVAGNRPKVAMDYAKTKDYFERFPDARRIKVA